MQSTIHVEPLKPYLACLLSRVCKCLLVVPTASTAATSPSAKGFMAWITEVTAHLDAQGQPELAEASLQQVSVLELGAA